MCMDSQIYQKLECLQYDLTYLSICDHYTINWSNWSSSPLMPFDHKIIACVTHSNPYSSIILLTGYIESNKVHVLLPRRPNHREGLPQSPHVRLDLADQIPTYLLASPCLAYTSMDRTSGQSLVHFQSLKISHTHDIILRHITM